MILRTIVVILVGCVTALAAPVPKELKVSSDSQRMQGVWKETNGTRWYFDGKKLFAGGSNTTDQKGHEYDNALRPEGTPGEIDLYLAGAVRFAGIYKFVDEEIHIAYHNGKDRPKDFAQAPGILLAILKRVPEAKK